MKQIASGWSGILDHQESAKNYKRYVEEKNTHIGAFLEFDSTRMGGSKTDSPLFGIPFAVKDNIAVKSFKCSCGSKMLENVVSPYTATAVQKLIDAGAMMVGKTNLDEFGMGSSTDNSALAVTNNPWDSERVAGGSSGGSAAAVAARMVPFALGTDTGGSIRQPASFCGVYGLKPTYGAVSRFGMVAYASSLEVMGILSSDVELMREVFLTMQGEDDFDQSSVQYEPSGNANIRTIAVLKGDLGLDSETAAGYKKACDRLKKLGYELIEIDLPMLEYAVPSYYTIATAEASANLARYTGIRYGYRPDYAENPEELVRIARDEGFGDEVKLRVLLGTYVLRSGFQDQYYLRAQKIRTAIRNDFDKAFGAADLIMMPTFPTVAFKRGEEGLNAFQQKVADKFTTTANLCGIPALSFPASVENGLPVGMQFLAPVFEEEKLFAAAAEYAKEFAVPVPEGYQPDWS